MNKSLIFALLAATVICGGLKDVKNTSTVAFEITIDGKVEGEIILGLFGDVVPKTGKKFQIFLILNSSRKFQSSLHWRNG